ncbi:unnamed protein product [Umbelopsis vinacea]
MSFTVQIQNNYVNLSVVCGKGELEIPQQEPETKNIFGWNELNDEHAFLRFRAHLATVQKQKKEWRAANLYGKLLSLTTDEVQ